MTLTPTEACATVKPIRCDHGHIVASVEPDGTIVVRHRDGCTVRIPPARITVVMEKAL